MCGACLPAVAPGALVLTDGCVAAGPKNVGLTGPATALLLLVVSLVVTKGLRRLVQASRVVGGRSLSKPTSRRCS
jgi:hypothetical protein